MGYANRHPLMNSTFNIHKTIAFLLNAVIIGFIIYFVFKTDSDKSPIIFMMFYPALTILNLIIAIGFWVLKLPQAKIYKQIVIGLLIIFLPLVIIISQF
jgi:hypothetical protein